MRRALCVVALIALAGLLIRSARVGLAGDYIDPVTRITAQDEALYSHSAIRMATRGGWLTPLFLGRPALYKPPMLIWLAALSTRVLGVSRLGLRLPAAVIAALAVGLIFLWAAESAGWMAGVCAVMLLLSNHLWHVLGSMCVTDALLAGFYTAAMYCIFADPWLDSRKTFWGFAAAVAAAVLTKSIAGLLPLGVLGLYWIAAPRKVRAPFSRLMWVTLAAVALAAPWFVYQAATHWRWFWTEHVAVEILGFGAGAPPQTTQENRFLFYALRMAMIDPVLTALAVVALPALLRAVRWRNAEAILLASWLLVTGAAVAIWQYRNVSYLLPMVAALAILASVYSPPAEGRQAAWMMVVLAGALAVKLATPGSPWGIGFPTGTVQPAAVELSRYCEGGRGNDLVVVDAVDDLYASVLPLPRLRYAVVQPPSRAQLYGMPFAYLGISLSTKEFAHLDNLRPGFRQRLRTWGLDSDEAIGTVLVARSPVELGELVRDHPEVDFFVPERYQRQVTPANHHDVFETSGYLLLLSRLDKGRHARVRTCAL